ncbi:MAG: NB-ARC domain-containing protein [Chloroflexota bacterium]|nr:NB-ARC domain-containing protein [Chloroflexota bacterium]
MPFKIANSPNQRDATHRALKLWHRDPTFGSPLDTMHVVRAAMTDNGDIRQATNQVLRDALAILETEDQRAARLLRLRFLDARMVYQVSRAMHVAESTVYRLQEGAIGRLSEIVWSMELRARAGRRQELEVRLSSANMFQLVGVDAHLNRLAETLRFPRGPWMVALEGIGGIGKSSLAASLVLRLFEEDSFHEFVWLSAQRNRLNLGGVIELVESPALTAQAMIDALVTQLMGDVTGAGSPSGDQVLAMLQRRLKQVPTLVVVDNLETLLDVESLMPVIRRLVGPSKFLLTSRVSLFSEADMFHFVVPELDEASALRLLRQEARSRNLPHLESSEDSDLKRVYAIVGGNPLALRLIVGQNHVHGLDTILGDLEKARGQKSEVLYTYIYYHAWQSLDELSRRTLLAMPLVMDRGGDLAYLTQVTGLDHVELRGALDHLVTLNLVDAFGGLDHRRYSIHNLTRAFLQKQVAKWQSQC